MQELLGKDLAGWRLETWYELRLTINELGAYEVGGYFTDKNVAIASGRGKAVFGSDGQIVEAHVLTDDGISGFVVANTMIVRDNQEAKKAEVIERAKSKLSPEERKLLGIE